MPSISSPIQSTRSTAINVVRHQSAKDFLSSAWPTLRRHERSANIILAHALNRVSSEDILTGFQFVDDSEKPPSSPSPPESDGSFWLTVWTFHSSHAHPTLDLVLSCTTSNLGNLPIFLWTSHFPTASALWLTPRITALGQTLLTCVRPQRVFSVFGMSPLVKEFAKYWSATTDRSIESEPFYAAYFTFCTPDSFQEYHDSNYKLPRAHRLRRATMDDLNAVTQLCKEFADDSIFFPLTIDKARSEALELISNRIVWVYEQNSHIVAMCAVTRSSQKVSAVTKVYTVPGSRGNNFAEHLVRHVTRILFDCGKESVVLYVGHLNNAKRVYERIGFVGLGGNDKPEGVEDSLELGFAETERGHW